MQVENASSLFALQSVYQTSFANQTQPVQQGASKGDTVEISSEARALYAQSLMQQQQDVGTSTSEVLADELVNSLGETSESEAIESSAVEQFKDVLDKHTSGNSGSGGGSAGGGGGGASGGGGSSSESSSAESIEEIENQIQQVASELAAASSEAVTTGSQESTSRVGQLEAKLAQLEATLTQLQESATESSSSA